MSFVYIEMHLKLCVCREISNNKENSCACAANLHLLQKVLQCWRNLEALGEVDFWLLAMHWKVGIGNWSMSSTFIMAYIVGTLLIELDKNGVPEECYSGFLFASTSFFCLTWFDVTWFPFIHTK